MSPNISVDLQLSSHAEPSTKEPEITPDGRNTTQKLSSQVEPSTKESEIITFCDNDNSDGSLFGDPDTDEESVALIIEDPTTMDKYKEAKEKKMYRNMPASELTGIDAPESMSCTLLPHQRVGLEWVLKQETGPQRGSILADDMGLGKTIQALALIHANPPKDPESCKTTLIVAPLALLQQWKREIEHKTKPEHKLSVLVLHGPVRNQMSLVALRRFDVVVTNYNTLCAESTSTLAKNQQLLLHPDMRFHRVILDEAHNIKNRAAQTSKAACRLQADYRLCLTGTPLMNRPEELYGMVHFLGVKDYSEWDYFNNQIAKPLKKAKNNGSAPPEHVMAKVRKLTDMTMLVRKKTDLLDGKPMITLPKHIDMLHVCVFGEEEKAFYDKVEGISNKKAKEYENAQTGTKGFASMLVQLLRMRQACCHSDLLRDDMEPNEGLDAETEAGIEAPEKKPRAKSAAYFRRLQETYKPSAKIQKTLAILEHIRKTVPGEKVLIFSFFRSFLDILAVGLRLQGFEFRQYDGTLNAAQKDEVISDFVNPNSRTRILLTSLQSVSQTLPFPLLLGGQSLN